MRKQSDRQEFPKLDHLITEVWCLCRNPPRTGAFKPLKKILLKWGRNRTVRARIDRIAAQPAAYKRFINE